MFTLRSYLFVCDYFFNTNAKYFRFKARSFSDALWQFEKEIKSSYDQHVRFFTYFASNDMFKYVIFKENDKSYVGPVVVEVYEE